MGFRLTTKAVRPLVVFRTMTTLMLQSCKLVLQTRGARVADFEFQRNDANIEGIFCEKILYG